MKSKDITGLPFAGAVRFIMIILLSSFTAGAQDVEFTASAPSVAAVGEQFRLTYTINARASNLRLPDLGNFQLVSGPSTSSSSSVQIINGEMTQTQSVSFTYVLRATEAGSYTLGPATISIGPDQYTSNAVSIEIVADSQGRSSVPAPQAPATGRSPADVSGEELFIRIMLDKNEVFQGEGVLATVKIFSKLDLTGIENVRFPAFSGFYQQDIETPPLRSLDREVINGEIYGTGVLRQTILFPQRNGEIIIESFEMDALVRQRTGRRGSVFDDFLGGYESRRIPVKSPPLTLKVKPLPPGMPGGFAGGVGNFKISAELGSAEAKTNEAVNLQLTISGQGNLRLLGRPPIKFPQGFEVYDPSVRENITSSARGQEGSITWEYLIIPRSTGNFTIPAVEFTYFDPSRATYRNISTGEFSLIVHRGEDSGGGPAVAGYAREDLRVIGSDIRFIKTTGAVLTRIDHDPYGSPSFYLWFIGPVVIFTVFILLQTKKIRDRADTARMKNRRASRMARRRLKLAGRYLKEDNSQQFFEETLRAVWGYLSDKLLIPVSELNRQISKSALLERGISEKDSDRLIEIISECEFARYAPSSSQADKRVIYTDTLQIITLIEQNIRK